MRVLLVEDDPMVGAALVGRLEDDAYAVDWVQRAQPGLDSLLTHTYDVVLLDLGLPELDGAGFLSALRGRGDDTPVIVVTARSELESRIEGLDLGADDYLVKPFAAGELMARIRAVLRRKGGDHLDAVLTNGQVSLDVATHQAWLADGKQVALSRREFAVIRALLTRPGIILSRDDLEHRVYGWGNEVESNAIEYLIHRVRAKLGADVVRNVRGVGWTVSKGDQQP
ncbi:MAG TPA: response regulator transcription factor [Propionicimonas sp.]|jgi:two-component system OmpR family response regulator